MVDVGHSRRLAVLAEGFLDFHHGKTAVSLLRYRPSDIVAVIDSTNVGRTVRDVLGLEVDAPIVASIDDAFPFTPSALIIGIAPRGGGLPPEWRPQLLGALQHGLDIISGLHYMLNDDSELVAAAAAHHARLEDVRQPPSDLTVADMRPHRVGSRVITFVGSDCAVGKMTAALQLHAAAELNGLSSEFVATGQTGIMLEGSGIAIDRVIGDFMSGAVERMVLEACDRADWVFVEGQGSLLHPAYSSVTLALLHGSLPDAMILVHRAGQTHIDEYSVSIPRLRRVVDIYEEAIGWIRPSRVVAVALNTQHLDDAGTEAALISAREETGLPVFDAVKLGGEPLLRAVQSAFD